jgi:predicted RNase H-like HicB family nuclease
MLIKYIDAAMRHAEYEKLDDGKYYGEISPLKGVWADGQTLEECCQTLTEVLEDWLILKLRDNDVLPKIDGIDLNLKAA